MILSRKDVCEDTKDKKRGGESQVLLMSSIRIVDAIVLVETKRLLQLSG